MLSSPRRSAPRLQALEGRQPGPWGCGRLAPPSWRKVGCMMGGWPQAPKRAPHGVQAPQGGGEDGDVRAGDVLRVVQVRQRGQAFLSPLPAHGQLSKDRVLELGHSLWPSRRDQDVVRHQHAPHPDPRAGGRARPTLHGHVKVQSETLVKRASELYSASCRRTQRLNGGVP